MLDYASWAFLLTFSGLARLLPHWARPVAPQPFQIAEASLLAWPSSFACSPLGSETRHLQSRVPGPWTFGYRAGASMPRECLVVASQASNRLPTWPLSSLRNGLEKRGIGAEKGLHLLTF